jgi:hypothetical protein
VGDVVGFALRWDGQRHGREFAKASDVQRCIRWLPVGEPTALDI